MAPLLYDELLVFFFVITVLCSLPLLNADLQFFFLLYDISIDSTDGTLEVKRQEFNRVILCYFTWPMLEAVYRFLNISVFSLMHVKNEGINSKTFCSLATLVSH